MFFPCVHGRNILPLNYCYTKYSRILMHNFVRSMGFEPMISGMKTQRPRPLDEPRMENLYSTPARIQTLITGSVDRRSVQLNYRGIFVWFITLICLSEWWESNPRPSPWQGDILTTELHSQFFTVFLSGKRSSNPRPSAWKADALPSELLPQYRLVL